MTDRRVWLITGISRGFGLAMTLALLLRGDIVIGTTRDGTWKFEAAAGDLNLFALDMTDHEAIDGVVARAHALHGRIDVVVNNAGYGLIGPIEQGSPADVAHLFDVNFFGPLRLIQAVLPLLRAQGFGHIVNITSIAGLAPIAGSGLYAASKFALEGLSEALAQEVKPLGLRVTAVEPGAFRTEFLSPQSIRKTGPASDAYAATSGAAVANLDRMAGAQLGDPEAGVRAIIDAVLSDDPPLHLVLGSDALQRARTAVREFSGELEKWADVSVSTDFPKGS